MSFDFYVLLTFMALGMVGSLFYRLFQFSRQGGPVSYTFQADKRQRAILIGLFVALMIFYFYYEIVQIGSGWEGISKILPFWILWWIYFATFITQTPKVRENGLQAATNYFPYDKIVDIKMEPGRNPNHSRLHVVAETKRGRTRSAYLNVVGDRQKVESELRKHGFLKSKKKKRK
jgi:hypothetical protein